MNENAAAVLKHIADKLDVPVQQLWSGLIAYAPFVYYQWLAYVVFSLVGGIVAAALCMYFIKKSMQKELPNGPIAFVCGALAFTCVVIFMVEGLSATGVALSAKHAPEAWAANHIIQKIRR